MEECVSLRLLFIEGMTFLPSWLRYGFLNAGRVDKILAGSQSIRISFLLSSGSGMPGIFIRRASRVKVPSASRLELTLAAFDIGNPTAGV